MEKDEKVGEKVALTNLMFVFFLFYLAAFLTHFRLVNVLIYLR